MYASQIIYKQLGFIKYDVIIGGSEKSKRAITIQNKNVIGLSTYGGQTYNILILLYGIV